MTRLHMYFQVSGRNIQLELHIFKWPYYLSSDCFYLIPSGPENINWFSSSLLHVALAPLLVQRKIHHRVISDKIQGKPRTQALHKILPALYLLMSHQLMQHGWTSSKLVREIIHKLVEMGRLDTLGTLHAEPYMANLTQFYQVSGNRIHVRQKDIFIEQNCLIHANIETRVVQ